TRAHPPGPALPRRGVRPGGGDGTATARAAPARARGGPAGGTDRPASALGIQPGVRVPAAGHGAEHLAARADLPAAGGADGRARVPPRAARDGARAQPDGAAPAGWGVRAAAPHRPRPRPAP